MFLSRDQIISSIDKGVEFPVPEWAPEGTPPEEAKVRVRGTSILEREEWEASVWDAAGKPVNVKNMQARLIVKCLVDDAGKRIFRDEDAEELGKRNITVINRLFAKVQELSGATPAAVEKIEKKPNPPTDKF